MLDLRSDTETLQPNREFGLKDPREPRPDMPVIQ